MHYCVLSPGISDVVSQSFTSDRSNVTSYSTESQR
jgi:hypothetical protein